MGVIKLLQRMAISCCLALPFAAQALAQFDDDKIVWPPVAAVPRIHVDTSALAKGKPDTAVTAEAPQPEAASPPKKEAKAAPKAKIKIAAKPAAQPKLASVATPRPVSEAATRVAFDRHQEALKPPAPVAEAVFESRVLTPTGEAASKPVVVAEATNTPMAIAPVVVTDTPVERNEFTDIPAPHAAVSQNEPPAQAAPSIQPPSAAPPFVQPGPPIVHRAPAAAPPLVAEVVPPMPAAPSYQPYVRPPDAQSVPVAPVPVATNPGPYQPPQGNWVWYRGSYHWVSPPPGYVAVRYVWRRGQWVPQLQQGWR